MRCPFCAHGDSKVVDSRPTEDGNAIRRRRECISCEKRFTTYEKIEIIPVMVIKKDGRREVFNRDKIMRGVITACEKRPVPMEAIEALVCQVENEFQNSLEKEISSEKIGERVMNSLKTLDEVAYVRFASVYRQFKDINTFIAEVNKLLTDKD
ncbi:MAG: transcriptional regulator NrdR [Clostridia bacterium]|nr:transcriptional regulator NrdR [Clostridia bacterium]